jgi:GTP pyrophosphokinase
MKLLEIYFEDLGIDFIPQNIGKIQAVTKIKSPIEFWNFIAQGKLTKARIKKILSNEKNVWLEEFQKKVSDEITNKSLDDIIHEKMATNPEIFMLDDTSDKIKYVVASCCNPLPGDSVVGFQMANDEIIIHQTNCPKAIEQMSKFGNRIIKAKWRKEQDIAFLSGIKIYGFDKKGMIREIINIISDQMDLNIRSMNIETKGNVFLGTIMLYIVNVKSLRELIEKLKEIDNIEKIERIGFENE